MMYFPRMTLRNVKRSGRTGFVLSVCLLLSALVAACGNTVAPPTPAGPREIVLYNWADDIPQSVLDGFTAKHGIRVKLMTYEWVEEAVSSVQDGDAYDVMVVENQFIPLLVRDKLLQPIDYRQIPNFKNISPNFRGLAYDPKNAYSVPYSWGTTGLVVRSDRVAAPVTKWADLWDPRYAGKIAARPQVRDFMGLTLLSLGYSLNSENPEELAAARDRLRQLRTVLTWMPEDSEEAVDRFLEDEYVLMVGWADDIHEAWKKNAAVTYVLPEEGTLFWGDSFVFPASGRSREDAHTFVNYLLEPDVNAAIVNASHYATANEAALPMIDPQYRNDPIIFPPDSVLREMLRKAEIILPLSPTGEQLWSDAWTSIGFEECAACN